MEDLARNTGGNSVIAPDNVTEDGQGLPPLNSVNWVGDNADVTAGKSKYANATDSADEIKAESLDTSGSTVFLCEKLTETQLAGKDMKGDLSSPVLTVACGVVSRSAKAPPEAGSSSCSDLRKKQRSTPLSPEELYAQIEQSRDKLFFIAYAAPNGNGDTPKKNDENVKKKWYLVRVDMETCDEVEEARNCKTSGRYYVEFYTKAHSDLSKPDSQSRFWLIWNTFAFKRGEMVIGNAREFDPNNKSALRKRLVDLSKKGSSDVKGNAEVVEFQPNLDRYTTWSDVVNLSDPNIWLVGPFDFEEVTPAHIDLDYFDPGNASLDDLYVRDRVPISRWHELLEALEGSDIAVPSLEGKKKKRKSSIGERKKAKKQAACQLCGTVNPGDESLLFHDTTSGSVLCVHRSCGLQSESVGTDSLSFPKIISTKEIWAMVDKTIAGVRQATASDGEVYCVLDEVRAQLISHLGGIVTQMTSPADPFVSRPNEGPMLPRVFPESEFTADEQQSFRVAFAHHVKADDPSGASEINAKIAKLDYEVEKRREKRLAREFTDVSKKTFPHSVVPKKSRSLIKSSTERTVDPSELSGKDQPSTKPGRGRPPRNKSPITPEPAQPVEASNPAGEPARTTEPTGSITLSKSDVLEKISPPNPIHTGSVAPAEMNVSHPTSFEDDPSGLSLVNQKIGVLARISAERRREKRRASTSSASCDRPSNKVARTSPHGEASSEARTTSKGDFPGSAESLGADPKKTRPKSAFAVPKVYRGPLLSVNAEPVGATLNLPHTEGWTMRCIMRPTLVNAVFLLSIKILPP